MIPFPDINSKPLKLYVLQNQQHKIDDPGVDNIWSGM